MQSEAGPRLAVVDEGRPADSAASAMSSAKAGVWSYLLVVLAFSWSCWFAAAGYLGRYLPVPSSQAAKTLAVEIGVFAPGLTAIAATLMASGWTGLGPLLKRLIQWRVGLPWYAFAILFMPAIRLGAAGLYRLAYGRWPTFGHQSPLLMIVATLASVLLLGQAGEELGWRGYALPRLSGRIGLATASVLLGAIWALWHLPLFFLFPQADTYRQSFPLFFAQVTALSVAVSWLWWRTNGSLLLTMLFHAAVNNLKDVVPTTSSGAKNVLSLSAAPVGWLSVALLWLVALFLLIQMARGEGRFCESPERRSG